MDNKNNLHLVQRSPFTHSAMEDCISIISDNDSILLMQDGVFALQQSLYFKNPTYALREDCLARGLPTDMTNIHYINMDEMVRLCSQHKQSISWF